MIKTRKQRINHNAKEVPISRNANKETKECHYNLFTINNSICPSTLNNKKINKITTNAVLKDTTFVQKSNEIFKNLANSTKITFAWRDCL